VSAAPDAREKAPRARQPRSWTDCFLTGALQAQSSKEKLYQEQGFSGLPVSSQESQKATLKKASGILAWLSLFWSFNSSIPLSSSAAPWIKSSQQPSQAVMLSRYTRKFGSLRHSHDADAASTVCQAGSGQRTCLFDVPASSYYYYTTTLQYTHEAQDLLYMIAPPSSNQWWLCPSGLFENRSHIETTRSSSVMLLPAGLSATTNNCPLRAHPSQSVSSAHHWRPRHCSLDIVMPRVCSQPSWAVSTVVQQVRSIQGHDSSPPLSFLSPSRVPLARPASAPACFSSGLAYYVGDVLGPLLVLIVGGRMVRMGCGWRCSSRPRERDRKLGIARPPPTPFGRV
jgi:hypothetical protein